jgi:hypothetical protein
VIVVSTESPEKEEKGEREARDEEKEDEEGINDAEEITGEDEVRYTVLWIRSGFNADPNPPTSFLAKPMRIHRSRQIRILIRLLSHKKLNFYFQEK